MGKVDLFQEILKSTSKFHDSSSSPFRAENCIQGVQQKWNSSIFQYIFQYIIQIEVWKKAKFQYIQVSFQVLVFGLVIPISNWNMVLTK